MSYMLDCMFSAYMGRAMKTIPYSIRDVSTFQARSHHVKHEVVIQ